MKVTKISPTAFEFEALERHPEGKGRRIRFAFSPSAGGATQLHVYSWGPSTASAKITAASGLSDRFWSRYADNLTHAIQGRTEDAR